MLIKRMKKIKTLMHIFILFINFFDLCQVRLILLLKKLIGYKSINLKIKKFFKLLLQLANVVLISLLKKTFEFGC